MLFVHLNFTTFLQLLPQFPDISRSAIILRLQETSTRSSDRPAKSMRLALTCFVLVLLAWIAASVPVLLTVSLESTVALFLILDDTITAESFHAVLEAVVFTIQLMKHGIQHLYRHRHHAMQNTNYPVTLNNASDYRTTIGLYRVD